MKNKSTAWTPKEDAALAAAVRDNVSAARLTVRLHRSEASIKRRMRQLGLIGKNRIQQTPVPAPHAESLTLAKQFLQACKAGDLASLMKLYDPDAMLECGCSGLAVFAGLGAIQKYWAPKVGSTKPYAFSLVALRDEDGRTTLDYLGYEGAPVRMHLSVDRKGKITRSECGPRTCNILTA